MHIYTGYPAAQKKKVLEMLKYYPVAKVFDLCYERVPLTTLYQWKKQLEKGESILDGDGRAKSGKKRIRCPELEDRLFKWFKDMRARQLPVRRKDMHEQALKFARRMHVPRGFKASKNWVEAFMKRNRITLRQKTRISTRNAKDITIAIQKFYATLNEMIDKNNYKDIWNYDEVGIFFEPGATQTLETKGSKTVSVLSVQATYMKMTIIIMISATGLLAPPVLLFHNQKFKAFTLPEHPEVLITSNYKGYNLEETNYNVVLPHFMKYIKEGSLLIHDECTAHRSQRIMDLLASRKIDQIRIPGGTTCLLQPVDCCIGKVIKTEVKRCYQQWCTDKFDEITSPDGRRRKMFKKPTNQQIADWVIRGVNKLNGDIIQNAFRVTGIVTKVMQEVVIKEKVPIYYVNKKEVDDVGVKEPLIKEESKNETMAVVENTTHREEPAVSNPFLMRTNNTGQDLKLGMFYVMNKEL
eukprot:TRINITY_DN5814_c0_g1_i1.p3 TRINITY_DN5814_c0_g1~~TRINITY_DN5814_c0_g1_i1.p3  ORF type:complete len:467 (+),score=47.20 TRINITY_DN5814_c0_g1_i1:1965-3365(+)